MNKDQAYKTVLATIAEIYDKQLSKQGRAIWFESIQDFTAREMLISIKSHIADPDRGRFAPKPADMHHQVKLLRQQDHHKVERIFHTALNGGKVTGAYVEFDGETIGLPGKHKCEVRLLTQYLKNLVAENGIDNNKLLESK